MAQATSTSDPKSVYGRLLFEHKMGNLYFDDEHKIFEVRWKPFTEAASDVMFKEFQIVKTQYAKKLEPKLYFCNTKQFMFAMSDEMQIWLDENIMTFWDNIGLKKMAFSTSEGHLQQLAVEVAVSENEHPYPIEYFISDAAAMDWLLNE